MTDLTSTLGIALLAVFSAAASFAALRRLVGHPPATPDPDAQKAGHRKTALSLALLTAGAGLVFFYRWAVVRGDWQPVEAHVDGLLLIASLFAATLLFLHARSRLPGLAALGLPLLTLLLAWSVCASRWTFESFRIESAWMTLHLASVYLGALGLSLAGATGAYYLLAQRRLRDKTRIASAPLASLESIETFIIRASTLGFALITLGLATGGVLLTNGPSRMGAGWWHSPKVLLSFGVWLVYAIVMNVRHASLFRGARAAWLSIIGVALLLATFATVARMPPLPRDAETTATRPAAQQEETR